MIKTKLQSQFLLTPILVPLLLILIPHTFHLILLLLAFIYQLVLPLIPFSNPFTMFPLLLLILLLIPRLLPILLRTFPIFLIFLTSSFPQRRNTNLSHKKF